MTMTDAELARYAQAVIGDCLGTQPGDLVAVHGEPAHAPLARALVEAAYRAGARYVDLMYVDPAAKRSRIQHADADTLGGMPAWHEQRMRALLAADASIVSITGESTPGLLGGLDPARAALERTSRLPGQRIYLRAIELGRARFCVVAWPVPGWAAPAYPELDPEAATDRVAADLLEFCRLAPDDPPDAWAQHLEGLTARADALTELALDRIEIRGAGTSLDLGLAPGTKWVAARERDHTDRMFCANLPTEEVFTSPDAGRVDGTFACTRPLGLDGRRITGIRGEFRRGKLVSIDADAPEDRAFLWSYFQRDRGASRLGELALVDATSRIGQKGRTYGLTLLDENAVSHIALGSGFAGARLPDPTQRGGRGVNRSAIHVDVMIGAPEQDVTGVRADGTRVPLISGGTWQRLPR
jgi:aminopeptidase